VRSRRGGCQTGNRTPAGRSPLSTLVFVYGTLLAGEANHHWLGDAEFLGADVIAGAELLDLGEYPMLRPGTNTVYGEVYGVSSEILAKLDELEEQPIVYRRQQNKLCSGRLAWVYWGQPAYAVGYPGINSGSWRDRLGNLNK
jgi:gamma-glutamylaminecyclotransferase